MLVRVRGHTIIYNGRACCYGSYSKVLPKFLNNRTTLNETIEEVTASGEKALAEVKKHQDELKVHAVEGLLSQAAVAQTEIRQL